MNDARLGIVRLPLPDGRAVPLCFTYAAIDKQGHDWLLEQFKSVQKGKAGSSQALADLLDLASDGEIAAADVMAAHMAEYPLSACLKSLWAAWELAQHGPAGRSAEDGPANPQPRRLTLWSSLFGRRAERD